MSNVCVLIDVIQTHLFVSRGLATSYVKTSYVIEMELKCFERKQAAHNPPKLFFLVDSPSLIWNYLVSQCVESLLHLPIGHSEAK